MWSVEERSFRNGQVAKWQRCESVSSGCLLKPFLSLDILILRIMT